MQSHEFFHEQAHAEKRHELKRRTLLITLILAFFILNSQQLTFGDSPANFATGRVFSILNSQLALISAFFIVYRFFCHQQEFEADRVAAEKCGRKKAVESLKFLQMREGKRRFWTNLFSLHPKTEKRIGRLL
ncbi:MAG: M48 family metalloprotease [Fibromonadaceae bacterium]|jgi:Zn-dependent protease with chaperone function|nr:M48 family metalloprotease [Fibromonadaceae bacterium]